MRIPYLAIAVMTLAVFGGAAEAKGCLKGAAVGGVGGHIAGGHGVLGAAAGCAVGRHQANKKDREHAAPSAAPATAQPSEVPKK